MEEEKFIATHEGFILVVIGLNRIVVQVVYYSLSVEALILLMNFLRGMKHYNNKLE